MERIVKNKLHLYGLFVFCAIIYNLAPLTQTYYFDDDIGRHAVGYGMYIPGGWGEYADTGRPAAEVVIRLLSGWFWNAKDVFAIDVHPFTKIISIFCLAFAGYVVYLKILKKETWSAIFVALAVVFSPFYIGCIQYRFDSATMGLALFFAVLPFLSQPNRKSYFYFFCCYLLSLSFYQCFFTVPILLVFIIILQYFFENKKNNTQNLHYWLGVTICCMAAFILYKLLTMIMPTRLYTLNHSQLIPFSAKGWETFKYNFSALILIFFSAWHGAMKIVLTVSLVLAYLGVVSHAKRERRNIFIDAGTYLFASAILLVMALLPFAMLNKPVFMARTLVGAQFVMVFWLLPICWLAPAFFKLILSSFILLYSLSCALNAAITNAIRSQYDYENQLFFMVLNQQIGNPNIKKIYIYNDDYYSRPRLRSVKNTIQNYPFTQFILYDTYMMSSFIWMIRQAELYNYSLDVGYFEHQKTLTFKDVCHWPGRFETKEFVLYGKGDMRVVDMKKMPCPQ